MLLNLHVKNLALIDEIEVDFFDQLNILTGETGAGKSILIGSIEAALGGKVSRDMIRQNAEYALIELLFQVEEKSVIDALKERDIFMEDNQLVIQRKIFPNRSICRVNDETVNLSTLREVASLLLDLHGQQENMTLKNSANQLKLLDQYIGQEAFTLREQCSEQFQEYARLKREYEEFTGEGERKRRELSFIEYEVNEIRSAKLKAGEDEELEKLYKKQVNSRQIVEVLGQIERMTGSDSGGTVSYLLGQCIKSMSGIADIDETTHSLYDQLNQMDSCMSDFNRELSDYLLEFNFNQGDYQQTEERLNVINQLKSKYGHTIEKILLYADEKEEELRKYGDIESYQKKLEAEYIKAKDALTQTVNALTKCRRSYIDRMAADIKEALVSLNFLQVELSLVMKETKVGAMGKDELIFLISTNPGMPEKPISQVASGGELSRIMLAVKSVLADSDQIATLIFDEIDTGVSGRTAQMVAEKLNVISRKHQVICITHLPQIAAMADTHFCITKQMEEDSTRTDIRMLHDEQSVKELARLLGGAEITDTVLKSAKEMKELALQKKREM